MAANMSGMPNPVDGSNALKAKKSVSIGSTSTGRPTLGTSSKNDTNFSHKWLLSLRHFFDELLSFSLKPGQITYSPGWSSLYMYFSTFLKADNVCNPTLQMHINRRYIILLSLNFCVPYLCQMYKVIFTLYFSKNSARSGWYSGKQHGPTRWQHRRIW